MGSKKSFAFILLSVLTLTAAFSCSAYAKGAEDDILKKSIELARKGSNDEAVAGFTQAIALNPASLDAYYNRGFINYKQNKLTEAIADFEKAVSIDPAYPDAYYNRALAYYKKGSYDLAIADYNKVMELSPAATDALYGRGLCYYKKNNIKQAIADFDKVIEMRPEFPLAYSARAIAYFSKKDYGRTLADVNKAVALGFRSRPLKEATPETIADTVAVLEKSQPVPMARDPKRVESWKAKRRLSRIMIYTLAGFLIFTLTVILALLIRIRRSACR